MRYFRNDESLLDREPRFDDYMLSLKSVRSLPRAMIGETKKAIAIARRFNDEVVKPNALDLDYQMQENPDYLPWDFIETANEWGFFTLFLPKMFGGAGLNFPAVSYFVEEIATECLAMANLIGVHYLGVGTMCSSWNLRLMNRILKDTVRGEREKKPSIVSLAITEPGAGTDIEDVDLVSRGRVACEAKRVSGGYVLNGRKIFISNGHLSTWHMALAYEDRKRPHETPVLLAIKTGMQGFSFGRQEHKMGQRGCPASELIFEDCFVPDDQVALDSGTIKKLDRSVTEVHERFLDFLLSSSRAGVGAFGAGVARGAYERALAFASTEIVGGKPLIRHEWTQIRLAEMLKNVLIARLAYVESNYANGLYGMYKILQKKPIFYATKYTPRFIHNLFVSPLLNLSIVTRAFQKLNFDLQTEEERRCSSGWASMAKFCATDMGIENCQLAVELMGEAGVRHDRGMEKLLRDAKLLQIYEGTNQLNRLNLFKTLIGKTTESKDIFED